MNSLLIFSKLIVKKVLNYLKIKNQKNETQIEILIRDKYYNYLIKILLYKNI